MGGSYFDSTCRLLLVTISLTTFSFFAFHIATQFRAEKGLLDCLIKGGQDLPIASSVVTDKDIFNVSKNWLLLYYAHLGAGVFTVVQITVATVAYQTKNRKTICDALVFPITMIHLPVQAGLFVWVHIARFSHSGKSCAGDYLSEEQFEAVAQFQTYGTGVSQELID